MQGSKRHRIPYPGSGSTTLLSGSCELDAVLRGGIPFGHVTELVGEAGSGNCELYSILPLRGLFPLVT
jgi:hypothetical protein